MIRIHSTKSLPSICRGTFRGRCPPLAASIAQQMRPGSSEATDSPCSWRPHDTNISTGYIRSCQATATLIPDRIHHRRSVAAHFWFRARCPRGGSAYWLLTVATLPVAGLMGWAIFIGQMAFADFLAAIRDIEENTRSRGDAESASEHDAPPLWIEEIETATGAIPMPGIMEPPPSRPIRARRQRRDHPPRATPSTSDSQRRRLHRPRQGQPAQQPIRGKPLPGFTSKTKPTAGP